MTFRATGIGLLALILAIGADVGSASAQQRVAASVTVSGTLVDIEDGRPIEGAEVTLADVTLEGAGRSSITDAHGAFRLTGVRPGAHTLKVRHVAYGEHDHAVDVPAGSDLALVLRLSREALELEPIEVEVEGRTRTETTRSNVVTRAQIESVAGRARHIGDVVSTFIPSAHVRELNGGFLCIEFRGAPGSRTTGCNFPMVVLDGLPITDPYHFLRDLRIEDLERIEFVPASVATARYGVDAAFGALVIETRRSGLVPEPDIPTPSGFPSYPWSREPAGHPGWQSFEGGAVGATLGVALGLAALGCFPGSSDAGYTCVSDAGVGAGLGALAIPILGSVLGSRRFGVTAGSRGRLIPSLGVALIPAGLGYAMYVQGSRSGFDGERLIGGLLLVVGTPLVTTVADHLFRTRR